MTMQMAKYLSKRLFKEYKNYNLEVYTSLQNMYNTVPVYLCQRWKESDLLKSIAN